MTDEHQIDGETVIEKDGSGNLVIKNIDEGTLGDIIDLASGNTVYDSATETLGDGTQDANLNSLNTGELAIGPSLTQTSQEQSIADDGAVSINYIDGLLAIYDISASPARAFFSVSFNDLETIISDGISNEGRNTTLSGTTGPDSSINIAIDGSDVYLENRTGESKTVGIFKLGGEV